MRITEYIGVAYDKDAICDLCPHIQKHKYYYIARICIKIIHQGLIDGRETMGGVKSFKDIYLCKDCVHTKTNLIPDPILNEDYNFISSSQDDIKENPIDDPKIDLEERLYKITLEMKNLFIHYLNEYDRLFGERDDKLYAEGKLKEDKFTRLKKTHLYNEFKEKNDKLKEEYQELSNELLAERWKNYENE